jgi:CBS domain-containing protein
MFDELFPIARDLMTQEFLAIGPSLGLLDAVGRLEQDAEHTAFVIDEQARLVGLLTEKDCLRALAARAYDEAVADTVRDIVPPAPPSLAPTNDVYTIAQMFVSTTAGMLPVVDANRVVGGVSQQTMVRCFLAVFRHRAAALGDVEEASDDLKHRPHSIEKMQQLFAHLNRDQLVTLLRRQK